MVMEPWRWLYTLIITWQGEPGFLGSIMSPWSDGDPARSYCLVPAMRFKSLSYIDNLPADTRTYKIHWIGSLGLWLISRPPPIQQFQLNILLLWENPGEIRQGENRNVDKFVRSMLDTQYAIKRINNSKDQLKIQSLLFVQAMIWQDPVLEGWKQWHCTRPPY